ncbi:MAG: Ubiquinone biosynthesis O-methyltransferase, mitochondrial [Chroococcopsis gigantea SAG 12.99]|jgi:2-polyprenyl-3-methyl-5-hydroxy-6-metoxy-1,4-benzoquinol methylase|nr:methyltransferase domain-containing protein [Chlorogloea purpurea SAG 13.99]MDV3001792.1 Ubiquinone biosynthesis O-methyltransferase, mitochondrial [Chroococcopsis gigantea SAG 12.99]
MSDTIKTPTNLSSYYFSSHVRHDLIKLISNKPDKVLEVGCGIGKTGKAIVEKIGSQVIGLDISAEALSIAQEENCYEKLVICDLDRTVIPEAIKNESFDCILYPDVLEHLTNPWETIKSHMNLLNPDGIIIASIPNIRHIYIIKELVFKGDWSYQDMGIMDKTHLRFFTKKTMIALFEEAGLEITGIKPRSFSGYKLLKTINRFTSNSLEEFLTTQYLICAKKKV